MSKEKNSILNKNSHNGLEIPLGIILACIIRFTLWPSKLRGRGIEWPNFVESLKKWAENGQ
jgi:hypothetical protein